MAERFPTARQLAAAVIALGLSLALGACQGGTTSTGGEGASADLFGTNAPAAGFGDVVAGSEEDFILNIGRRIYFARNSSELDATATATLDQQADWLVRNAGWLVKLQGFSDDPGSTDANVAISQKRADAVMGYLVSRGVAANRLWAKGYGRDRIVRDCPEERCQSQNRRVVSNLRNEYDAAAPQGPPS